MTERSSMQRSNYEPKAIVYDQRGNQVHGVDQSDPEAVTNLHDLYARKFLLIEAFEHLRKDYVPPKMIQSENDPKNKLKRQYTQWDYIVEEAKWTGIDMMENRKAKIAIDSFISKRVKKSLRQKQTHETEIQLYHRLVSSELSSMVTRAFDLLKEYQNSDGMIDVKEEADNEEVIKIEDTTNGMTKETKALYDSSDQFLDLGDGNKDEEILDYDMMKQEETTLEEKKPLKKIKTQAEKIRSEINEMFKATKPKHSESGLRKYIQSFMNYDAKTPNGAMISEEEEESPEIFSNKIDKQFYVKELQKCFSKWNKNKYAPDLADALSRLTKEPLEVDKTLKLQREASSNLSLPSLKDDPKKRKKSYIAPPTMPPIKEIIKETPIVLPTKKLAPEQLENSIKFNPRDMKRMKEKENTDELLYMYYDDPINDHDFEGMFKISVDSNKYFPRSINELPLTGFQKVIQNPVFYEEPSYDPYMDKFVTEGKVDLEVYMSELHKKPPKESTKERIKHYLNNAMPEVTLKHMELIHVLPLINEKSLIVYNDKIRLFKFDETKNSFDSIKWPIHVDFIFERLNTCFGNKTPIITDVLNSNILTKGTSRFLEKMIDYKWLFMQQNKMKKFSNCNKRRLASYSSLAKDEDEKEEPRLFPTDAQNISTLSRFKLKKTSKEFTDYYERNKEFYKNETLENTFPLLSNIKNYIKQDFAKNIYGGEIPEKRTMEPYDMNRITFPEVINRELQYKLDKNVPLTGQTIKKTKVPHPQFDKIKEEIIQLTLSQNPPTQPRPQGMIPNPNMPMQVQPGPNQPFIPTNPKFTGHPQSFPPQNMYNPKTAMIPEQMRMQQSSGHYSEMENPNQSQSTQSQSQHIGSSQGHTMRPNINPSYPGHGQGGPSMHPKMMMGTQEGRSSMHPMSGGMNYMNNVGMQNMPINYTQQQRFMQMKTMGMNPSTNMPNVNQTIPSNMNPNMNPNINQTMGTNMNPSMGGMQTQMRSMNQQQQQQMDRNTMNNMKKK